MSDPPYSPFLGRSGRRLPTEQVLWTLHKGTRIAEARTRQHPLGPELVFYVDGELLWSQVFKDGQGAMLDELVQSKRDEFEARGWAATPDGSARS